MESPTEYFERAVNDILSGEQQKTLSMPGPLISASDALVFGACHEEETEEENDSDDDDINARLAEVGLSYDGGFLRKMKKTVGGGVRAWRKAGKERKEEKKKKKEMPPLKLKEDFGAVERYQSEPSRRKRDALRRLPATHALVDDLVGFMARGSLARFAELAPIFLQEKQLDSPDFYYANLALATALAGVRAHYETLIRSPLKPLLGEARKETHVLDSATLASITTHLNAFAKEVNTLCSLASVDDEKRIAAASDHGALIGAALIESGDVHLLEGEDSTLNANHAVVTLAAALTDWVSLTQARHSDAQTVDEPDTKKRINALWSKAINLQTYKVVARECYQ